MKKIVSGLIAVLMMAAALVAFSGTAANAAKCNYAGCQVVTYTKIQAPSRVKAGSRARICVKVTADANGTPRGHVALRVVKYNGKDRYIAAKYYGGGKKCFRTTKLHLGRYTVKAHFSPKAGSKWAPSGSSTSLRVVKRHHR